MNKITQTYYSYLDAFRAFAVAWVIIYHINIFFDLSSSLKGFYPIFFRIANVGELGVDMFFVISGFLISGLLYDDLDSDIRIRRFYGRRFFKIIPQYLTATLVALVILKVLRPFNVTYIAFDYNLQNFKLSSFSSHNEASILGHIFFYQNFADSIGILSHTWSLAIEEHFYLGFPLLLVFVCKLHTDINIRKKLLLIIYLTLIAAACFIKLYYINVKMTVPQVSTFYRYDALIFGCLLRLLEPEFFKIPKKHWKILSTLCLISGLSIFLSFIVFGFNKIKLFSYPLAYFASGLLIVAFIRKEIPFGLYSFLNNKILRWVGRNSYGMYLWHYIIIYLFFKLKTIIGVVPSVLLYIIAVIVAGYISTITIEKYFLNIRKKLFQ